MTVGENSSWILSALNICETSCNFLVMYFLRVCIKYCLPLLCPHSHIFPHCLKTKVEV